MSKDWVQDIKDMDSKYDIDTWIKQAVEKGDTRLLNKYLAFRLKMMYEELGETIDAAFVNSKPEEVVDGLIDLSVFCIETLNIFGVDVHKAWNAVYKANMNKQRGQKPGRENPYGFPDLIKEPTWEPPCHKDNTGYIRKAIL